jgi:hypothetical protein
MLRSITELASANASLGENPYNSPISLTISTVATTAASLRSSLMKPKVIQPPAVRGALQRQLHLGMHMEFTLRFHWAIKRGARHLAVTLRGMPIAGGEKISVQHDW